MSKERFLERQANAKDSVSRLVEAVGLEKSEIVRDAVIHRFEFSYEAVWKALQIYLEYQGHECPGSRSVVRKAFAERFISTEEEAGASQHVPSSATEQPATSSAWERYERENSWEGNARKVVEVLRLDLNRDAVAKKYLEMFEEAILKK